METLQRLLACAALIALTGVLSLHAQNPVFKVLIAKGNATVQHTGSAEPLGASSSIGAKDRMVLGANAYVALMHSSGKTLELKTPGTYTVPALVKILPKSGGGISKRFATYAFSQISSGSSDNTGDRGTRMNTTGSTERLAGSADTTARKRPSNEIPNVVIGNIPRAVGGVLNKNSNGGGKIQPAVPTRSNIVGNVFRLAWHRADNTSGYNVRLKGLDGSVILTHSTNDTAITLNVTGRKLTPGQCYSWQVWATGDEENASPPGCVIMLTGGQSAVILKDLTELSKELGPGQTGLRNMILAGFYRQNGMNIEALESYRQAVRLSPGVTEYSDAYLGFLKAMGMEP